MVAISRYYEFDNNYKSNKIDDIENHSIITECVDYGWYYSSMIPNNKIIVTLMTDNEWIMKINKQEIFKKYEWNKLIKNNTNFVYSRINHLCGEITDEYDMRSARSS